MKSKKIIFILVIIILLALFASCSTRKTNDIILFEDIDSITIIFDKDNEIEYTSSENKKEIQEFINALNEGKSFGNIEEITHDTSFTIYFKDGTAMTTVQ